jgi:hypothetical protein
VVPLGDGGDGDGDGDGEREPLEPEEAAVLAGFDRLSPEGSVQWDFEEALRRLDRPEHTGASLYPWGGLPDDLWERGRAARIGQRFVGDVTAALADILAADARRAADAAIGARDEARFLAAYDALRYLAARVAALENRLDPTGLATADLDIPPTDSTPWAAELTRWLGAELDAPGRLVVGEAGDRALLAAAAATGRDTTGVEPRGAVVWDVSAEHGSAPRMVLAELAEHLSTLDDGSVAGLVLAGAPDRLDLAAKCALARDALRVVAPGGRLVLLVRDQGAWDAALGVPGRDLVPGRPLHPVTWTLLLTRYGADDVVWHPHAEGGSTHVLVVEAGG